MTDKTIEAEMDFSDEDKAYFDGGGTGDKPEIVADDNEQPEVAAEVEADDDVTLDDDAPTPDPVKEDRQKTVPHAALHAEREEHKKTKSELSEIRSRMEAQSARMEQIIAAMQQAGQKQEPQANDPFAEMPNVDEDPIAAQRWMQDFIRQQVQSNQQVQSQQQQQRQQIEQYERTANYVAQEYDRAFKQDPTIEQAFRHAEASFENELRLLGYSGSQFQMEKQRLLQAYTMNAAHMMQRGVPLADFIKQTAQVRGWQPQPETVKPNAGELDRIARNAEANKSMSQISGTGGKLTAADVDNMSDEEFGAWLEKAGDKGWQKLNGLG